VFLLFLVHCDRPFVGPVYEVILALVRNVRNGARCAANHRQRLPVSVVGPTTTQLLRRSEVTLRAADEHRPVMRF
jgi:hypothetical protein